MDDGHGCGKLEDVEWFIRALGETVQLKEAVAHRSGDTYEHLKRVFEVGSLETHIRSNPRYVDKMADILGLMSCNTVSSPLIDPTPEELEGGVPLDHLFC